MASSIREIASTMDPVHWPKGPDDTTVRVSIRELAGGHRWLGLDPQPLADDFRPVPEPLSVRQLIRRHQGTRHHFLSYNTFLLPGFIIPWDGFFLQNQAARIEQLLMEAEIDPADALGRLPIVGDAAVAMLGVDPLDFLDELGIKTSAIADKLGLGFVGDALEALIEAAEWIGKTIGDVRDAALDLLNDARKSILEVAIAIGRPAVDALGQVCTHLGPAGLFSAIGVDLPDGIGEKPLLDGRTEEIGAALGSRYELMALCEVYLPSTRNRILDLVGPSEHHTGPDESSALPEEFALLGSGLLTVTSGRSIAGREQRIFANRGRRLHDMDAWSNKGVIRSVIDLGVGFLDLYQTHLVYGGGLFVQNPGDLPMLRMAQAKEVVAFYRETHEPTHVGVITGDFNLDANDPGIYQSLRDLMASAGLFDAWVQWNRPGVRRSTAMDTHDVISHDFICFSRLEEAPHGYCDVDEQEPSAPPGHALEAGFDYIFVERPTTEHAFDLDLTIVRRAPFKRPANATGRSQISHMSDHIGLDVTLLASTRNE